MSKKLMFVFLLLLIGFPTQTSASEGSLYGRVVILDAGHGSGSPGGTLPAFGYFEYRRMFFLAVQLQSELLSRGATVHMTRNCPMNVALPVRPAMMNRWSLEALLSDRLGRLKSRYTSPHERIILIGEINRLRKSLNLLDRVIYNHRLYAPIYLNHPFDFDLRTQIHPSWRLILEFQSDPLIRYNWLAISLHSNASSSLSMSGADVYFSGNNNPRNMFYFANYSHEDISEMFGRMLLGGISRLGIRANRVRARHFMIIRETNLPAVLVENGYHTNEHDRSLLMDNNFMRRLATVYADTIEAYFERINQYRHQYHENAPLTKEAFARLVRFGTPWQRTRLVISPFLINADK